MIKILDLIKLGEWLNENNIDTFGKQIRENDCILLVNYETNFIINGISKKSDLILKDLFDSKSCYSNELYITTDQRIMIPSKSNLMGLSPFCLKLDHNFIKKDNLDKDKINKFKNKVIKSLNANKNNKEFVNEIEHLYNNEELLNSPLSNESKKYLEDFFSKNTLNDLKKIILDYYQFIYDNVNYIITLINEYKNSDNYNKKDKSNFYLVMAFNNDFDLINDIFYFYSKFIKVKNQFSGNPSIEKCVSCGKMDITVPSSGSFITDKYYFFNNNIKINNSHLKLCKKCNAFMSLAEDKLKKSLISNLYLIPKSRENNTFKMDQFIRILNSDSNDFYKLNELLYEANIIDYYDLDLAVYTQEQGDSFPIRKYVENYRTYLIKFDDIDLVDMETHSLNYLFDEKISINDEQYCQYFQIRNMLDIERIFRNFFTYVDSDGKYHRLYLKYLYQIYSNIFSGKQGITKDIDARTASIFSKYMQNMFSFIYELNFNTLNKNALNEIVLNCILHYVKINHGESYNKYNQSVRERLNEYYMLMDKFWGEKMFDKTTVKEIKEEFKNYNKEKHEEFKEKVIPLIESNNYIKYYFIGQFIKYIDNFKRANGFNPEVFNNFMQNVNRNNVKKMFATEILQKNIYYINKMSKKSKILFEIIESNLEKLFEEEDMTYEDYILTLCTGYYTENILSSQKEDNEGEKDE